MHLKKLATHLELTAVRMQATLHRLACLSFLTNLKVLANDLKILIFLLYELASQVVVGHPS